MLLDDYLHILIEEKVDYQKSISRYDKKIMLYKAGCEKAYSPASCLMLKRWTKKKNKFIVDNKKQKEEIDRKKTEARKKETAAIIARANLKNQMRTAGKVVVGTALAGAGALAVYTLWKQYRKWKDKRDKANTNQSRKRAQTQMDKIKVKIKSKK